jgi:hypothetical protein
MNDILIVYFGWALCLVFILWLFKFNKQLAVINLTLFFIYNSVLYYNLLYNSAGGTALVWWFYLLVFTAVHILVISVYLAVKYFTKSIQTKRRG